MRIPTYLSRKFVLSDLENWSFRPVQFPKRTSVVQGDITLSGALGRAMSAKSYVAPALDTRTKTTPPGMLNIGLSCGRKVTLVCLASANTASAT